MIAVRVSTALVLVVALLTASDESVVAEENATVAVAEEDVTATVKMLGACTSDAECLTGFCHPRTKNCQCALCNKPGCRACPEARICVIIAGTDQQRCRAPPKPTSEPTRTPKPTISHEPVKSPTRPPNRGRNMFSVCRDDTWCESEDCFKTNPSDEKGKCNCYQCSGSGCGGCLSGKECRVTTFPGAMNRCVSVPKRTGEFCRENDDCQSGNCFVHPDDWFVNKCQCNACEGSGCAFPDCRADGYYCLEGKNEYWPNRCQKYEPSMSPTKPPTAAPTQFKGVPRVIGERCMLDSQCRSGTCWINKVRLGQGLDGTCQCRPKSTWGCPDNEVCIEYLQVKNRCGPMPTARPSPTPSTTSPTTPMPTDFPTTRPSQGPTDAPINPTRYPTRRPKTFKKETRDRESESEDEVVLKDYGEDCVASNECVTYCCAAIRFFRQFRTKCKSRYDLGFWEKCM